MRRLPETAEIIFWPAVRASGSSAPPLAVVDPTMVGMTNGLVLS